MKFRQLRHRITIQTLTEAADELGGRTETWTDFATCWAHVRPLQGNERYQAQQAHAETSIAIELRYRGDITARQRVLYRGQELGILAVINENMLDKKLILLCSGEAV
jgi:SPP1 family predicted phage head-tail adaptor